MWKNQWKLSNIREASASAGYVLCAKHRFGHECYPGYVHEQTVCPISAEVTEAQVEYVFEKTSRTKEDILGEGADDRIYSAQKETHYKLPEMATDGGSTDYLTYSDS